MSKLEELIQELCPDGVETFPLEECCNILDKKRKPVTKNSREKGEYPYYGANGVQDYVSDYIFNGKFVLVGEDGSVITKSGTPVVTWAEGKIWVNNHAHVIEEKSGTMLRYLYFYIQTIDVTSLIHGNIPKLTGRDFRSLKIALPPLEIQREIVSILDNFTNLAAKKAGVIYILTNPSFPDYVKIGYATNIENRLKQLNRSECIPFAFRVYATYDVSTPLQDKELHSLIDRLNPDLRAIDTFDGKTRTKEFYAMTKEDAYALLESIAKLSGTMDKLQRLTPEGHEIADEEVAAEIQEEAKERKAPFSFIKCGIPMGAEIVLQNHPEVVAVVKDDRQIEYQGKTYSLSALAQKIMQTTYPLQGPVHWLYQGRKLRDIRVEREEAGLYE